MTPMRAGLFIALPLALGTIAAALAATTTDIVQRDKSFGRDNVTIATGDKLNFVNADQVPHNIYVPVGDKFDLGIIKPGESKTHVFTKSGTFPVHCALHPRMKMAVTVK